MKKKKNIIKASSAQLQELEWYVGNKEVHLLRIMSQSQAFLLQKAKMLLILLFAKATSR